MVNARSAERENAVSHDRPPTAIALRDENMNRLERFRRQRADSHTKAARNKARELNLFRVVRFTDKHIEVPYMENIKRPRG